MSSFPVALRNLLIYAVCIPLALFLGYQLSNPMTYEAVLTVAVILGALLLPVVLRWHRPILFVAINAAMVMFFLPGRPKLGVVMVAVSLLISILHRTIQPNFRFLRVPEMTWPLLAVIGVVVFTMALRGGLGLAFLGASTVGGSRYLMLILGVLCFFAMTAQPIPREKRSLYINLFFLGGVTAVIGDFFAVMPSFFRPLYLFFPPSALSASGDLEFGVTRLYGVTLAAATIFRYMLARYGLKEILGGGSWLRLVIFVGITLLSLVGGSRLTLLAAMLTVGTMFYLEGLHRTRMVLPLLISAALVMVVAVAALPKMPFAVQRSLAFLPVSIDPAAKMSADNSSEWRVAMWRALLPEVPGHLLLGRGLGIADADLESIKDKNFEARTPDQWLWAAIVGDFHNGPLSVVLTFGIWGVIAFVWLQMAGLRVLYLNWRNGEAELKVINTCLLTLYSVQIMVFWFVFGSMYAEIIIFTSLVGFGVAINGGVCRPPAPPPLPSRRPPPSLRRGPAPRPPLTRPALGGAPAVRE